MIRTAIMFLLLASGAFFIGIYLAYDEFDPCRALAVETARRAPVPTGIAEAWNAITSERRDPLSCTRSLIVSWRERIAD